MEGIHGIEVVEKSLYSSKCKIHICCALNFDRRAAGCQSVLQLVAYQTLMPLANSSSTQRQSECTYFDSSGRMRSNAAMPNASDVITYIGIPLAVLGVLPILYTAVNSLLTLQNIKRKLRVNGVKTLATTSSLMSGVVEVSLPRYSITPLDREEDAEYWKMNPYTTSLKGGTWTIFNWNCLITGSRLYRLQYSSDVQIPQAEISLEELFSFLLDRGAVPDVKGMHLFCLSGLWTPIGTTLMLSPDTTQSALRISLPDDSDGVMSMSVSWNSTWDGSRIGGLRPGWMRVDASREDIQRAKTKTQCPSSGSTGEKSGTSPQEEPSVAEKSPSHENSQNDIGRNAKSMRLRFSHTGRALTISKAVLEYDNSPEKILNLEHLDFRPASTWIPVVALGLGILKSMPLYHHNLDDTLSNLALRNTVPCGVLVMLGVLDDADAPSWETKYDRFEDLNKTHSAFLEQSRAIEAERNMPPNQVEVARRIRLAAEVQRQSDDFRERIQRDRDRRAKRAREAIASARLDTEAVAKACLKYLITQEEEPSKSDAEQTAGCLLIGMLTKDEHALSVCDILERWRIWNDRGGMNVDDIDFLSERKTAFCRAACVMSLVKAVFLKQETSVAADMRECGQRWQKIRLG